MGGLEELEMFFVKLDVDRLRLALLRSAPHYPRKWAWLNVSWRLIFASTFMAGVGKHRKGGIREEEDVHHKSIPPI
jgi:hypothetical protein